MEDQNKVSFMLLFFEKERIKALVRGSNEREMKMIERSLQFWMSKRRP